MEIYSFNEDKTLLAITDSDGLKKDSNLLHIPNCVLDVLQDSKAFKPIEIEFDGISTATLLPSQKLI